MISVNETELRDILSITPLDALNILYKLKSECDD